jgi:VWFA-related protein
MRLTIPVALAALATAAVAAQQTRFSSRVDVVQIDALVTDGGRPVSGLTAVDFELRDNGVPQQIDLVRAGEVPLDVVLLLDVSGSVQGSTLESLREAARAALAPLRPQDRAALVGFAGRAAQLTPLTSDRSSLERAADRLRAGGLTSLYDALFASLLVSGAPGRRLLLLAYTDGLDSSSWLDATAVASLASRSDVVIYVVTVAVRPEVRVRGSQEEPRRRRSLAALAEPTGGSLLLAERASEVQRTFSRVVEEFRNRYLITYYPNVATPGWHRVELTLKGRAGAVRARRGYFND